jgi:hypothetical protein
MGLSRTIEQQQTWGARRTPCSMSRGSQILETVIDVYWELEY